MKDTTSRGRSIFDQNSDRHPNEAQEVTIIPKLKIDDSTVIETTYIKVRPFSFMKQGQRCLLCKPVWMWGAEMGSNAAGVIIGNEAAFPKISGDTQSAITTKVFHRFKTYVWNPVYGTWSFCRLMLSLIFGGLIGPNDYHFLGGDSGSSYNNNYYYTSLFDDEDSIGDNNSNNGGYYGGISNDDFYIEDNGYLTGVDFVRLGLMFADQHQMVSKLLQII